MLQISAAGRRRFRVREGRKKGEVVGLTELESVTSCVSSRRSNQLSYKPLAEIEDSQDLEPMWSPKPPRERSWSPNGVQLTAVNL